MITKEFRKLFADRLTVCVLCFLLLLNMFFCAYTVHKQVDPKAVEAMKAADKVYRENPDEIIAQHELYEQMNAHYMELDDEWSMYQIGMIEETDLTGPPTAPNFPSTYAEGLNDYRLFTWFFSQITTTEQYREIIDNKINSVTQQMIQYKSNGYDTNAFAYRLNIRYLDIYQRSAEQIKFTDGYVYGWNLLFSTEYMGLFVFLSSIFLGSRLFLLERDTGMHSVLRVTRRGRVRLAIGKIVAALLIICLLTVLFFGSAMLMIGAQVGFSSPWDSVQLVKDMIYCPFSLNMAECLGITMCTTAISAFGLLLLTACLSLRLRRSLISMLVSAAFVGSSFYCFVWGKIQFLKYVNIFTTVSVNELLGNWRAVRIGSHPISQLIVLGFLLILLLAICMIVLITVWGDTGIGATHSRKIQLPLVVPTVKFKPKRKRNRSLKLSRYEFSKLFTAPVAVGCVCLIALKIFMSVGEYTGALSYADEMKHQYMQEYSALSLQETAEAVSTRLAEYEELVSKDYSEKMATMRLEGDLSAEEYAQYHVQVNNALRHMKTLTAYLDEVEYLLGKEAETGITAKPVLSVGYEQLTANDFEPILVALYLLLFCGSYAKEYETGSINLLRTTKQGRHPVWLAKFVLAAGTSMLLSLSFIALDTGLILANYDMSCLSSPLFAISRYENTVNGITVGQYLFLLVILRTVCYTLLGMLIAALSCLLRSEWLSAGTILLLFIPYLLAGIGLTVFQIFDFTMVLSVDRLYLYSTTFSGLWFFVIFIGVWIAIITLLSGVSHRKFCK